MSRTEVDEPDRTPGSAEGLDPDHCPHQHPECAEPHRTPGSAEGEDETPMPGNAPRQRGE
jgi:hypothetical protein